MGVYINMEMPKSCAHCMMWSICPALPNGEWPDYESILTNDVIGDGGAAPGIRHPDCPLVPVPPHGDLIDRDALIKDGWLNLHKEVMRMGGYAIHELPLKNPSIAVIIPAEEGET